MSHKLEFDAHRTVKEPERVSFRTKDGTPVRFTARVPVKEPMHVSFRVKDKK